jgi:hypothetical protein
LPEVTESKMDAAAGATPGAGSDATVAGVGDGNVFAEPGEGVEAGAVLHPTRTQHVAAHPMIDAPNRRARARRGESPPRLVFSIWLVRTHCF